MKQFLINEFGWDLGTKIYDLQQKRLQTLIGALQGKSSTQTATLIKTILPRIALYHVLHKEFGEQGKAYYTIEKYMLEVVGPKISKQYSMLEFLPGYFSLFRKLMAYSVHRSDNWVTEVKKSDRTAVVYTITKCLWYDACAENNCPELCKIFCDVDHVIYDSLRKVKFVRTGTIGTGAACCDFCFLNTRKCEPG